MTESRRTGSFGACARRRARGVGLVETMVGILIGMIVILVVYNILAVAEGYRRTTVGASDAQINGLPAQFVAGRDAGNGGAGITVSNSDLINCTRNDGGADVRTMPVTQLDAAVRPIPLLIIAGGNTWTSDSFISMWGGAAHVMWPVDFIATSLPGSAITVQSPNGFTVPPPSAAAPYWAVVMVNDPGGTHNPTGTCKVVRLVAATAPDPQGRVTVTQDPVTATSATYWVDQPARLLNLGPTGQATRVQYDVVAGVLRTTDLLVVPPTVPTPVPFAQNIVLMKVQYGIDTNANGFIDCWTAADNNNTCGDGKDYSANGVRAMPLADLNRILAVRIGVVVRSDEPDLRLLTDPGNTDLQHESAGILKATRPQPYLFSCSANNATCQSRVKVPMGNGGGAATCGNNVICDYWRYRTYETVIPLRNAIFSATLPP
jgi:type IV pilus assembly protein PilW